MKITFCGFVVILAAAILILVLIQRGRDGRLKTQ